MNAELSMRDRLSNHSIMVEKTRDIDDFNERSSKIRELRIEFFNSFSAQDKKEYEKIMESELEGTYSHNDKYS